MRESIFPSSYQQLDPDTFREDIPLSKTTIPCTSILSVKRLRHRWQDGYHFGVLCCALTAGTVLIVNTLLTVIMGSKFEILDGIGTFQDGDCDETKRLDLWLHLLINILSTLLLGASNYSMQCLCAPTRQDIDNAHRQNVWMDIGVPSVRNIYRISWPRRLLWCLLFMSSVPVHLMYNSVIFSSTSVSEWSAFAVTSDFLTGATYNTSDSEMGALNASLQWLQNSTSLVRLENDACIAAYEKSIVSAWSDVLLISTQPSTNGSLLWAGDQDLCYSLPTDQQDSCVTKGLPDPNNWSLGPSGDAKVSHCMAAKAQEHCKMRFSLPLMIAVITCNLIKVICIGIIVWKLDPRPLVTIGDAIASFLDSPDSTTAGNCLANKSRFKKASTWAILPSQYRRLRHRWFASASISRWLVTVILCTSTLAAAIRLLVLGIAGLNTNYPFSLGFGAININAVILIPGLNGNLLASILLANSPQVLLSFLYFAYNGLWTCMLLAQEWSSYAKERKPLRVTSPRGIQRSTYRLQLPYRYGIPLLIVSGVLHWLVSQSIFLVILDAYNFDGTPDTSSNGDTSLCGYSPIAILTTIISGTLVLNFGILNGFQQYPTNGIPLASSCSAAISAACHPPAGDDHASRKAVMWGACGSEVDGDWDRIMDVGDNASNVGKEALRKQEGGREPVKVGHCSFTSFTAEKPIVGEWYAGFRSRKL